MKSEIIKNIVKTSFLNKEGHIASALSVLDFLQVLYFNILEEHDKFILSKGHASLALYSIFLEKKYITKEQFYSFCQKDSILGGHPSSKKIKHIHLSTGSLGHGLPVSVGLALAKKINKENGLIYCLIGDGESNEGTIWESALAASSLQLDNLICIMDFNKSGERAIKINDGTTKFNSFGWETILVDNGHDQEILKITLENIKNSKRANKPTFIQLNTIKGFGIDIMENNPEWHHKQPQNENEYFQIINSIK